MRARVDPNRCAGTGWCLIAARDVFELDDDGRSHARDPESHGEGLLRRAAEGCPMQAVILEDEDGTQLYP